MKLNENFRTLGVGREPKTFYGKGLDILWNNAIIINNKLSIPIILRASLRL